MIDGALPPETPAFVALERSSLPAFAIARQKLGDWFEELPKGQQDKLRPRLRDHTQDTHESTVFELIVHAFLLRNDCRIIAYEPHFGNRRPDFLVRTRHDQELVIEATVLSCEDPEHRRQSRFQDVVREALRALGPVDFWAGLSFDRPFLETPSAKKLQALAKAWRSNPERDERLTVEVAGGRFTLEVIESDPRGKLHTFPAVAAPAQARHIDQATPIRKRLKDKARQLQGCEYPSVVALSLPPTARDEFTLSSALFGDERFHVDCETGKVVRTSRKDNSPLVHRGRPNNRTLSGVLSFPPPLHFLNAPEAEFWANPWASHVVTSFSFDVVHWLPDRTAHEMRPFDPTVAHPTA